MKDWVEFCFTIFDDGDRPIGYVNTPFLPPITEGQLGWRVFLDMFVHGFLADKQPINAGNLAYAKKFLTELILYGLKPEENPLEPDTMESLRYAIFHLQEEIDMFESRQ